MSNILVSFRFPEKRNVYQDKIKADSEKENSFYKVVAFLDLPYSGYYSCWEDSQLVVSIKENSDVTSYNAMNKVLNKLAVRLARLAYSASNFTYAGREYEITSFCPHMQEEVVERTGHPCDFYIEFGRP